MVSLSLCGPTAPGRGILHQLCANAQGEAQVVLSSEEFGVALSWDAAAAPYFTQWKNYRKGTYVCGIEPGNCVPEGQNRARRSGRLQQLGTWRTTNLSQPAGGFGKCCGCRRRGSARSTAERGQGEPVSIALDDYLAASD
jgi:hypothetical protein